MGGRQARVFFATRRVMLYNQIVQHSRGENRTAEKRMTEVWAQVAAEAIDRLIPYGTVILLGMEGVRRQLGRHVDRGELIKAKSVYALLAASFARDQERDSRELLAQFVRDPAQHGPAITRLVAERAGCSPNDFGRKLVALTNQWREDKRPLPPVR